MPATYVNLASTVLSSAQSNVTLSSIPQTYTDLMLICSMRGDRQNNADPVNITLNGGMVGGTSYSYTTLYTYQSAPAGISGSNDSRIYTPDMIPQNFIFGNVFCNLSIYLPNYISNQTKPLYLNGGFSRLNAATSNVTSLSGLVRTTSSVTSIVITTNGLNAGSSFYLYGIKNT